MALNCMKEAVAEVELHEYASSLPSWASLGKWLPGILPLRPSPTACQQPRIRSILRPLQCLERHDGCGPLQTAFSSVACTDRFINVRLRRGRGRGEGGGMHMEASLDMVDVSLLRAAASSSPLSHRRQVHGTCPRPSAAKDRPACYAAPSSSARLFSHSRPGGRGTAVS